MRCTCNLIKDYSGFCEAARQRREKYGNKLEAYCNNPGKSGGFRLVRSSEGWEVVGLSYFEEFCALTFENHWYINEL